MVSSELLWMVVRDSRVIGVEGGVGRGFKLVVA